MTVRAKFTCLSKENDTDDPGHGSVTLQAVHTGSAENDRFFSLTPAGSIALATLNPEAFAQFEPGKDYYIDFTAVETVEVMAIGG